MTELIGLSPAWQMIIGNQIWWDEQDKISNRFKKEFLIQYLYDLYGLTTA